MTVGFNKGNFVKFVRGTPTLWNSLVSKDSDTLYFIVNSSKGTGALYLGDTLIAGNLDTVEATLAALADVSLTGLATNDVLVYNTETQKWENKSIASAINETIKVMEGATVSSNGSAGLVPQPMAGQQKLFLQGNGAWANPTAAVELTLNTLIDEDTGKSIRNIAKDEASTAVAGILDGAPESFDTLKEIADWIGTHPEMSDVTNLMTRVGTLEDAINGKDEQPGLISNVNTLTTTVSNLNTIINGDGGSVTGLVTTVSHLNTTVAGHTTAIAAINEALKWQDMFAQE